MNPLIVGIMELAIGIAKNQTSGTVQTVLSDASALEQIVKHAAQAYQEQTGQPLDVSLLTYEAPIE